MPEQKPESLKRLDGILNYVFGKQMGIAFEFIAAMRTDMIHQDRLQDCGVGAESISALISDRADIESAPT